MPAAFSDDEVRELPDLISAPRFATYLRAMGGDKRRALALYRWNVQVSAAFFVPLQICEVSVRNGVVVALEQLHGPNWPWSRGFQRSLPRPRIPTQYDAQRDLQGVASRQPTAGKVVAELKFAFWEKVFTVGQDQRLWLPYFNMAFPGVPSTIPIATARARAFSELQAVRNFRNRIAHHEPIITRNLASEYGRLREIVGWRSQVGAAWLDQIEDVTRLIAIRPV